jgi:hypothetical protein
VWLGALLLVLMTSQDSTVVLDKPTGRLLTSEVFVSSPEVGLQLTFQQFGQ